ncbi:MAG: cation:dicarboxylase symporter family transporter, partial [Opitutus sp.]
MASPAVIPGDTTPRRNTLYLQVLVAIVVGGAFGYFWPAYGIQLKPLGDGFIRLVRMLIAPIIFTTVVVGLAGMGDLKKVGRVGFKAILYFEIATTVALAIGLIVANVFQPGAGFHANAATLDAKAVATYTTAAQSLSTVEFLLNIIPKTFVGAFVEGEILQVLLLAVLFGLALGRLGEHARPVMNLLNEIARVFFGIVSIVTRAAPIAAFGAMAFTIGAFGLSSLARLASLMACVYLTCAVFVFGGLGLTARLCGFSLWKILKLIREEL